MSSIYAQWIRNANEKAGSRMQQGTSEFAAVVTRLERLEKQNRLMKQLGVVFLLLVGTVFLMGQVSQIVLWKQMMFIFTDSTGRVRAILGIPSHIPLTDRPAFSLMDEAGT